MAHQPDPTLLRAQEIDQVREDRPTKPGQGTQHRPSSLRTLVARLCEPAFLERAGRVVAVNAALEELVGRTIPVGPRGVELDRLVAVVEAAPGAHRTIRLDATMGPLELTASAIDMVMRDDRGTVWLLDAPVTLTSGPHAVAELESVCAALWEEDTALLADPRVLVQRLDRALDHLRPALQAPTESLTSVVREACEALPHLEVEELETLRLAGDAGPILALVDTLLTWTAAGPGPVRVGLRLDLSRHPTLVLRRDAGPVLAEEVLLPLVGRTATLGGSLAALDDGRCVRLRLQRHLPDLSH